MGETVIVGGGASGLMAAIAASEEADRVTLLEHTNGLGKKILSTGNGRCNLTNRYQGPECYRSGNNAFQAAALKKFGFEDTLRFFEGLGLFLKERDGYYYPRSMQASSVRNLLEREARNRGVDIRTEMNVTAIERTERGRRFLVRTPEISFGGDRVILACGGMAAPVTGSDGSGYVLAKELGHSLVPPVPALTGLEAPNPALKKAAGVRTFCRVSLYIEENGSWKWMGEDTGELQLTDYGISGIPVFQVSRYAARALEEGKAVRAYLNFLPEYEKKEAEALICHCFSDGKAGIDGMEILCGLFPEKLAAALLKTAKIPLHVPAERLGRKGTGEVIRAALSFSLDVTGVSPFSKAQVTAGGIDVNEVDGETMESKLIPGLFFAGEILDVDGICGGYNLQWAWTSGWLAGKQGRR